MLACGPTQEVGQKIAPGATRAEMRVGYKDAPVKRAGAWGCGGVHAGFDLGATDGVCK